MINIIKAAVSASKACVAIVIARFNSFINERLLEGAIDVLKRIGQIEEKNITVIWVPGSYEIPITVNFLTKNNKYDAVVALGTIVRGETMHFKCISDAVSNGLAHIARNTEIPITFGLLVTDNIEQAIERAGSKIGNKGAEAALSALEMINILKNIKNHLKIGG